MLLATGVALVLLAPPRSLASPEQECTPPTILDDGCTPATTQPVSTTTETTQHATSTSRVTTTTTRRTATTTPNASTATTSPPPTRDLLVAGDGTNGAGNTTTDPSSQTISSSGPSDGTLITLIVVGLGLIAGVMGTLTWRYWTATQSPPVDPSSPRSRSAR